MRSALIAGALLAFALSFDEVIVTTFTAGDAGDAADLDPQQPVAAQRNLPVVNVVAVVVVILSIIPVYFAQRLSNDVAGGRGGGPVKDVTAVPLD